MSPRVVEPTSPRTEAAIARALAGDLGPLRDLLERGSGLPGVRPNLALAGEVGSALAAAGARGEPVVRALLAGEDEFGRCTAAMALAARWSRSFDVPGSTARLQALCEDERRHVTLAVVEGLRQVISARGQVALDELAGWTDGYLQAHAVLSALADRTLLTAIGGAEPVLARLDEAFTLADEAPRAADRSHGVRALRRGLSAQIAVLAGRFHHEVVAWLMARSSASRPETREVLEGAFAAMKRASFSSAEVERLSLALAATAKPPRDPSRIVGGTRRRGGGRRR